MLQNAYFLAKIGADTAENEQHFAEILPKIGNYPTVLAQSEEHYAELRAQFPKTAETLRESGFGEQLTVVVRSGSKK